MTGSKGAAEAYPYQEEVNQAILRFAKDARVHDTRPRVLDVGCGYGALGQEFRTRGCEVWGLERDDTAVERATPRIDKIVTSDITDTAVISRELAGQTFDLIVFSDVLEHMPDPHGVVVSFLPYLAPRGRLVISVPNVANWFTRFSLLFGRFTYRDTGVLDKTHVRFFTVSSAAQFVQGCGLHIQSTLYTPMLVRVFLPLVKARLLRSTSSANAGAEAISDSPLYRRYLRWIYPVERRLAGMLPGLLAFQIVMVADLSSNEAPA